MARLLLFGASAVTLACLTTLAACGSSQSGPTDTSHDAGNDTAVGASPDSGSGRGTGTGSGGGHHEGGAGAQDTGVDGYFSADAGTYDALPPVPQVQNADGGVLSSPVIISVFFANEDQSLLPSLEQIYTDIGSSSFWAVGQEYGVGAATAQNFVLTENAPATIDDTSDAAGDNTALETWLLNEISTNALPAPTPNTTYMINYPAGTTVTSDGNGCEAFDGYHSDMTNSESTLISYGVIPRCTDPGSTTLITFSSTVSHELMEASTDPYPDYSPAWAQADNAHLFFDEANDGSEVADMCENDPEAYTVFPGFPFTVQRIWSNASALAGHDPCVPEIPGAVFYNAVPELPDTGPFDYYGNTVQVSSVKIPVGGTKTVYVDLYSDGSIADWDVNVLDYGYFNGGNASDNLLDITMPKTTGNNGTRLPVVITVKSAGDPNTNGQIANTEIFAIISSQGTSQTAPAHYWYGIVTN